jgi:uncharacterized membrane protein
VAGGVGAKRGGQRLAERVRGTVEKAKGVVGKASEGGDKVASIAKAVSEEGNPLTKLGAAVRELGGDGSDDRNVKKLRLIINERIDVAAPRRTAYNQWTQFEELPSIVKGAVAVDQQEDDTTQWTAKIGPSRRRWTAEIDEQIPDERIVWHSTEGAEHRGAITFHRLDASLTRVQVEMEYFPHGFVEKLGNLFLVARRRVRKDLRLFKHYLELAGEETGAWRGEISKDEESQQDEESQKDEQSRKDEGKQRARSDGGAHDGSGSEGSEERAADEPAEGEQGQQDQVGSQS